MDGIVIINLVGEIHIHNTDAKRRKAIWFEYHLLVVPPFRSY